MSETQHKTQGIENFVCDAETMRIFNEMPCTVHSNVEITKLERDYAEGVLHVLPEHLNYVNYIHGGCLAGLADIVAGAAACSRGIRCVTVNYMFHFLRPAKGSLIKCVATPLKVGRRLCVYRADLTDEKGAVVAAGDFTFNFINMDLQGNPIEI